MALKRRGKKKSHHKKSVSKDTEPSLADCSVRVVFKPLPDLRSPSLSVGRFTCPTRAVKQGATPLTALPICRPADKVTII